MWNALFGFTNAMAMIGWALLAFFPRRPLVHSLILYLGVALLCLIYLVLFTLILGGWADPHRLPGAGEPGFSSIEAVRAIFMSDGGVVVTGPH